MSWATKRADPSRAYLLPDDQPAMTSPMACAAGNRHQVDQREVEGAQDEVLDRAKAPQGMTRKVRKTGTKTM